MSEMVAGPKLLKDAGCDYDIAYDLRTVLKEQGKPFPSPLDQLRDVTGQIKLAHHQPRCRLARFGTIVSKKCSLVST